MERLCFLKSLQLLRTVKSEGIETAVENVNPSACYKACFKWTRVSSDNRLHFSGVKAHSYSDTDPRSERWSALKRGSC